MFERYTGRARRAVVLAQEEARMMGSREITPGHLLLGLAVEEGGVASIALSELGLEPDRLRDAVRRQSGTSTPQPGHIPFRQAMKKALEDALRESLVLGHNYIATEHLLLGLLHDGSSPAGDLLIAAGIAPPVARAEVMRLLESYGEPRVTRSAGSAESPPWCSHLMTLEAGPADEMDLGCTDHVFVSRCICGHEIPWGPYQETTAAMREHLVTVGLLAIVDQEGEQK